jgi:DNA-directed RNA polymerase specialized sigma24 family protein
VTELLRKAVTALSELPPEEQDAVAAMVLEELAFAQVPSRFAMSIEALEEEARLEHFAGRTEPLNF